MVRMASEFDYDCTHLCSDLCGKIALEIFCMSCLSIKTNKLRTDPQCLKEDDYLRDCLIAVSQTSVK